MNASERLVEIYYRHKKHFTVSDVKVFGGINRQIDLITYDPKSGLFYHIESSIGHRINFAPNLGQIYSKMKYKFFGDPKETQSSGNKTDKAKGKSYLANINETYRSLSIDPKKIIRVWCTWCFDKVDHTDIVNWKIRFAKITKLKPENFELLSFRDEVMPMLLTETGTPNYDDDLLRCLSLVIQHKNQTEKISTRKKVVV